MRNQTDHIEASATQPREVQIEQVGTDGLRVWAPAKINLNLLVGPVRDDGYHPLDSLVAKVTFYDAVLLTPAEGDELRLTCEGLACGPVEENLALRAARLLQAAAGGTRRGARIHLTKHIPPGAGLGGGSSDAAAVLVGLSRLWGLSIAWADLADLAGRLGSDVPLFLGPWAVRMTGRGEHLRPVGLPAFHAVLYLPRVHCSTREVYAAFDRAPAPDWHLPDLADLTRRRPSRWADRLENHLAGPACEVSPDLAEAWRSFGEATSGRARMTGSGSGMFALCDGPADAGQILAGLPEALARRSLLVRSNTW